jgi:hypothetical protein
VHTIQDGIRIVNQRSDEEVTCAHLTQSVCPVWWCLKKRGRPIPEGIAFANRRDLVIVVPTKESMESDDARDAKIQLLRQRCVKSIVLRVWYPLRFFQFTCLSWLGFVQKECKRRMPLYSCARWCYSCARWCIARIARTWTFCG